MILFTILLIALPGYFLFRRVSKQLLSNELPRWFRIINTSILLPILAWPIIFYGTIFFFDNPKSEFLTYLAFVGVNAYPLYLILIAYLNCLLFKRNKKAASIIPGIALIILTVGVLYVVFSVSSVIYRVIKRDFFTEVVTSKTSALEAHQSEVLDTDSTLKLKYEVLLNDSLNNEPDNDYSFYLSGFDILKIPLGEVRAKHVYPMTFYNASIQVDSNNVPLKSEQFYFPEALFPSIEMIWEQTSNSSFDVRPEYNYEKADISSLKWNSMFLFAMQEPLLFNNKLNKTVFRFTWLRTFHNPVVIRIENDTSGYFVYWKMTDGAGGYETGSLITDKKRRLDNSEWDSFESLVTTTKFWDIERSSSFGTDGSEWVIEGAKPGRYYVTSCWTPSEGSGIYRIGDFLLGLTDLEIEEGDKY